MRNMLKITIVWYTILGLYSCNKEKINKQNINKEVNHIPNPPFDIFMLINKKSEEYKSITTEEGKLDKGNVYFYYETDDKQEMKINSDLSTTSDYDGLDLKDYAYLVIKYQYVIKLFKEEKEQVLYLVSKNNKLPINIIGNMTIKYNSSDVFKLESIAVKGQDKKVKHLNNKGIVYLIE